MKTLRVQPIYGKFLSSTVNGKTIKVWLVDPVTGEQGTVLPYDDAVALLTLRNPVACLAQVKGKDGKIVQQMTDEELKSLTALKEQVMAGVQPTVSSSNEENSALKALVETQAALLKSQESEIENMKNEFSELKKLIAASAKKSKKAEE